MTDDTRRGRGRPKGGRRASDPIEQLETHPAAFIHLSQLVDYWGVHIKTLHRMVERGNLRAYRFGREFRIKREDALVFERTRLFAKRSVS